MSPEDPRANDWLPRLDPGHYQGYAAVFWTFSVLKRATGWLDPAFHHHFREILLHAGHRYNVVCPAYVLMPDHLHFLWLGIHEKSDQRKAAAFLRTHAVPRPFRFQKQPHDHVLRESERKKGAFQKIAHYILANPERKGLVKNWRDWGHGGCVIPGYPRLCPKDAGYWEMFWKIYWLKRNTPPPSPHHTK